MRTIEQQMKIDHKRRVSQLASIPGLEAEIARLQEQVETLTRELASEKISASAWADSARINLHRAEAAEAERDRLRALEKDTSDKFFTEHQRAERLEDAIRRVIDPAPGCNCPPWVYGILFAALKKEPRP